MNKKFEINRTKIKGGCQSARKVVTHDSKSDLSLVKFFSIFAFCILSPKQLEFQGPMTSNFFWP